MEAMRPTLREGSFTLRRLCVRATNPNFDHESNEYHYRNLMQFAGTLFRVISFARGKTRHVLPAESFLAKLRIGVGVGSMNSRSLPQFSLWTCTWPDAWRPAAIISIHCICIPCLWTSYWTQLTKPIVMDVDMPWCCPCSRIRSLFWRRNRVEAISSRTPDEKASDSTSVVDGVTVPKSCAAAFQQVLFRPSCSPHTVAYTTI
jgi:hypothetical protein